MIGENKRANVASELGRADESMRAARVLVDAALLHDAESRLYYAIYHAAVALLLTEGLEADYGRNFVLTEAALREDLASCQGFLDRARSSIAGFLG